MSFLFVVVLALLVGRACEISDTVLWATVAVLAAMAVMGGGI